LTINPRPPAASRRGPVIRELNPDGDNTADLDALADHLDEEFAQFGVRAARTSHTLGLRRPRLASTLEHRSSSLSPAGARPGRIMPFWAPTNGSGRVLTDGARWPGVAVTARYSGSHYGSRLDLLSDELRVLIRPRLISVVSAVVTH
jgi:hypothetical protein